MAQPGEFLDSNVLVYAFTTDARAQKAEDLLARGCTISVQGLNEFANVARRKLRMDWQEVDAALASIKILCHAVRPLDLATHESAMRLSQRFGFSIYDALIVAAALQADCSVLWSEDMQDGLVVEGRLRIANPFKA